MTDEFDDDEPLIAVARNKFFRGVEAPGDRGETYDWRLEPGSPGNTWKVVAEYEVMPLREALTKKYWSDAHYVGYIVRDEHGVPLGKQPRVNKAGLPWMREQGFIIDTQVFTADIDNPKHGERGIAKLAKRPWDVDLFEEAERQWRDIEALQTCMRYFTSGGWRALQEHITRVPVEIAELYLITWLGILASFGIRVDWACVDWTRHFRLANVIRELKGQLQRSYSMPDMDNAVPIEITPDPEEDEEEDDEPVKRPREPKAKKPKRSPRRAVPVTFSDDLPEDLVQLASSLGRYLSENQPESFHIFFRRLAGALLHRRVPAVYVPEIIKRVAASGGSLGPHKHMITAQDTIRKWADGLPVEGMGKLRVHHPSAAMEILRGTARPGDAIPAAQHSPTLPTANAASNSIRDFLEFAPPGVTLVSAECGAGKSEAAILEMTDRANKGIVALATGAQRLPLGVKTGLSTNTNDLAIQHVVKLRALGIPTLRVFSPASLKHPNGSFVCKYQSTAQALVDGGLSIHYELCRGQGNPAHACMYSNGCTAQSGMDGPENAIIAVGPHETLPRLSGFCGSTGHLDVDEPPKAIDTISFPIEQLAKADAFQGIGRRYQCGIRPALRALLRCFLEVSHPDDKLITPAQAVEYGLDGVAPGDLVTAGRETGVGILTNGIGEIVVNTEDVIECARSAHKKTAKKTTPPFSWSAIHRAKQNPQHAEDLRDAAVVYNAVYEMFTDKHPPAIWVERRNGVRTVVIKRPNKAMYAALHHPGPTALLDASMEAHRPIVEHIVGYKPLEGSFPARDGAPIERTLIRSKSTRSEWFDEGNTDWTKVARSVGELISWAMESPEANGLVIITFLRIRIAIEAALGSQQAVLEWQSSKRDPAELQKALAALTPVLARWDKTLQVGHYGKTRGFNSFMWCNTLATLGDPWPNMDDVSKDCEYAGLSQDWEARLEAIAREELEQAHGRLRACRRTEPARAAHHGRLVPAGTGWRVFVVREPRTGRDAGPVFMTVDELQKYRELAGGAVTLASIACVKVRLMRKYLDGEKHVPEQVAVRIRNHFQDRTT